MVKYRKRIPRSLISILNRKEIDKTFNTQAQADSLNKLLDEAVLIVSSGLPEEVSRELILKTGLKQYHKQLKSTVPMPKYLSDVSALYLAYSKDNTTLNEYKVRLQFFTELLPELFKVCNIPLEVSKVTPHHLHLLSKRISKLPNRRLMKNRGLTIKEYLSKTPPVNEQMLPDSCNKMIKRIRGLANYGTSTGLYTLVNTIPTLKVPVKDGNRVSLTKEDYTFLSKNLPHKALVLFNTIYYSGIRPSELHKLTIKGGNTFDLTNPTEPLKTKSSYRVVPIHSTLIPYTSELKLLSYSNIRATSKVVNKYIKLLPEPKGKSLYSARHSFITNLINSGVEPTIVSELVGHSHTTMTMSNYFDGYSMEILSKAIELLPAY